LHDCIPIIVPTMREIPVIPSYACIFSRSRTVHFSPMMRNLLRRLRFEIRLYAMVILRHCLKDVFEPA
jgi:hypothetical protein